MNENAVINDYNEETPRLRPWWERYQPVSYNVLTTRSGTEEEFKNMVKRCNDVGVRIYVDAVINHMTGRSVCCTGTGGSTFNAADKDYPEYSAWDFNSFTAKAPKARCPCPNENICDYNSEEAVRNCELEGLRDLDHGKEYVRQHIAEFLNKLVNFGVAGFRVDACKHMWPKDLEQIYNRLDNLSTEHGFAPGTRPFIYQEVIESDTEPVKGKEYFDYGRVTEFKYGRKLGEMFRGHHLLKDLVNWGTGWSMFPDDNALVFIDNHDNQRGHGGGGDMILTFRVTRMYKMATALMLAHPYGVTRVMSSYYWDQYIGGDGKDKNDWVNFGKVKIKNNSYKNSEMKIEHIELNMLRYCRLGHPTMRTLKRFRLLLTQI